MTVVPGNDAPLFDVSLLDGCRKAIVVNQFGMTIGAHQKITAEAAAQTFGRTKGDVEKLVADSGRTPMDFYSFFWEYLLDDRETIDLKKEWKAARNKTQ